MLWTDGDRERLLHKVEKQPDGCWMWTGAVFKATGYGVFNARSDDGVWRPHTAHRSAYLMFVGPIPEGFQVDHLCRVRLCANPTHLEAVTQQENNRRSNSRSARQARQTHCIHGHPLSGENLRIKRDGRRECRACARAADKRRAPGWKRTRAITDRLAYYGLAKTCRRGHAMDEANTYWAGEGRPMCRACRTLNMRVRRAAQG